MHPLTDTVARVESCAGELPGGGRHIVTGAMESIRTGRVPTRRLVSGVRNADSALAAQISSNSVRPIRIAALAYD